MANSVYERLIKYDGFEAFIRDASIDEYIKMGRKTNLKQKNKMNAYSSSDTSSHIYKLAFILSRCSYSHIEKKEKQQITDANQCVAYSFFEKDTHVLLERIVLENYNKYHLCEDFNKILKNNKKYKHEIEKRARLMCVLIIELLLKKEQTRLLQAVLSLQSTNQFHYNELKTYGEILFDILFRNTSDLYDFDNPVIERLLFGSLSIYKSEWLHSVCPATKQYGRKLYDDDLYTSKEDKDLIYNFLQSVVPTLKRKMKNIPLVNKYIDDPENFAEFAHLLVKEIVLYDEHKYSISESNIIVFPLIHAIQNRLNAYAERIYENIGSLTCAEILDQLSIFAVKASAEDNPAHTFSVEDNEKYLYQTSASGIMILDTVKEGETTKYRFKLKHYRLVLLARHLTKTSSSAKELFMHLCNFQLPKNQTATLTEAKYDAFVLLATAVTLQLKPEILEEYYDLLISYAADDSISSRTKQVAAICTLSHLLYENTPMSSTARDRAFRISYGRAAYSIQIREAYAIFRRSPYFTKEIQTSFENLGNIKKINDDSFFEGYPLFFFYFHVVKHKKSYTEYQNALIDAAVLCNSCWEIKNIFSAQNLEQENAMEDALLNKIFKQFKYEEELLVKAITGNEGEKLNNLNVDLVETISEETLKSLAYIVFAIQQTAYALHDVIHINLINKEDIKKRLAGGNVIKLIIISDYIIRSRTPAYAEFCRNSLFPDPSYVRDPEYFLVGASLRITSALSSGNSCYVPSGNDIYHLTEVQASNYNYWLEAERGRYQVLIRRMLLLSDYYSKWYPEDKLSCNCSKLLLEGDTIKSVFLEYDNISAAQIKQLSK